MEYDVWGVRGLFPSLGDGWIHLDAQVGMQIADSVARTVSTAFRTSVSDPSGAYPSARRSAGILDTARAAVADLVGADPAGVVLGPNRATLLARLAEASRRRLGIGTEVVLSRVDDEENITPWLRAAHLYGSYVKWAEVDIENFELPTWQYAELVGEATALVAVTAASSTLGVKPEVAAVAKLASAAGALTVVDAAFLAPYEPVDIHELGVDVLALDSAIWGGPPVGALVFRDPAVIDRLERVAIDPTATGPAMLEVGAHQYAMLAGMVASIEVLAGLASSPSPGYRGAAAPEPRRERIVRSMSALRAHQAGLFDHLVGSLRSLPLVMVLGARSASVPMLSFTVAGVPAHRVTQRLADNGICALTSRGGSRVLEAIGVGEVGGAVTVGLGHYSTVHEVDQLVRVVASLG
ncbi:cysteine desulfurase-like protein [Tomitella cavernea]|uniref:Cysteine desulfurase-like protein n=1 Tax=Tomitella cavernea TaxID=1387982 RepID=A0ABP9C6L1_9ACTN|nr:cysteine desulfurase-like protein [Tomitella cavernea]